MDITGTVNYEPEFIKQMLSREKKKGEEPPILPPVTKIDSEENE